MTLFLEFIFNFCFQEQFWNFFLRIMFFVMYLFNYHLIKKLKLLGNKPTIIYNQLIAGLINFTLSHATYSCSHETYYSHATYSC